MVKKEKTILFNILISIFAACISIMFYCSGVHDYDFLWHIKLGEYIIENHKIFTNDIYSWLSNEYTLIETAHSWGFGIILYFLSFITSNIDIIGLIFCGLTGFLATFIIFSLYSKIPDKIHIILVIIIASLFSNPRPQNLSYILFTISIWILIKYIKDNHSKVIWFLPLIALIWANVHGGTLPMLFAFECLFLFMSFLPTLSFGKFILNENKIVKKPYIKLGVASLLSIFTGFINPYGWKLYIYFFITNDKFTKKYIVEWQEGKLSSPHAIVILILLFIPLIFSKEKVSFEKWIIPFICLIGGGVHERIFAYGVFAIIPLYFTLSFKKDKNTYIIIGSALITGIITVILFLSKLETSRLPDNLLNYLKEAKYERLFNSYDMGAKLIYEEIPCFIDSRADLYDSKMLCNVIEFENLYLKNIGDIDNFLNKFKFDAILIDSNIALTEYFLLRNDYNLVFNDMNYYIFEPIYSNYK